MDRDQIIAWLIEEDVSIQYQVFRDLLKSQKAELQNRIANEGWGKHLLSLRKADGHWGMGFYQPKWTSTHYTLLDLKNLSISQKNKEIKETIDHVIKNDKDPDGGINPAKTVASSDLCICGMFLNYACYFGTKEDGLKSIVDFILSQKLTDGGFNCRSNRSGATHSSLHTTLSVLEGFLEFRRNNYTYRIADIKQAELESKEFILEHKLFQSHRTGITIDKKMLMLSYPSRWRYDILRALDYFRDSGTPIDMRMMPAIEVLLSKRNKSGTWPLQAKHAGQVHFEMEETGKPSRWNTLRAQRVMDYFGIWHM